MRFSGKVVLVTGASSGIGEDAAIEFANQNASVVLVGRDERRLNSVVDKIKSNGSPIPLSIAADVSKDAHRIIDETIKHFGRLDVLINNAGIYRKDSASTVNLKDFDELFATNVRAVVELTKLSIPYLEKTKGNVVNISSFTGLKSVLITTSYGMMKAALSMYTKCASLELAPKGIRVNEISPGLVKTEIVEKSGIPLAEVALIFQAAVHNYPVGRLGKVSDTTNAILFLADEQSSFINGVSLVVDGGRIHN